jgi:hypothetical protein
VTSVIDLVFAPPAEVLTALPHRELNLQASSDHVPISARINHRRSLPEIHKHSLKQGSDKEKVFLAQLIDGLEAQRSDKPTSALEVESLSQAIAGIFSRAWLTHSKEFKVSPHLKEYWTDECTAALEEYHHE